MIIPYEKKHWEVIDLREHEKNSFNLVSLKELAEKSVSFTVLNDENEVVTIGGILINHKEDISGSVWEIWQCPSKNVSKNTNLFASAAHKLIEIARTIGAKKIMTACLIDDLHDRWITFLKFKPVGEIELDGNRYNRYERVL